jgi:hypothetical protein
MDKITFIKVIDSAGIEVEHAVIEHENGSFTSMAKSTYDEMKKAQDEAETI